MDNGYAFEPHVGDGMQSQKRHLMNDILGVPRLLADHVSPRGDVI
jgi:hypothetical protein